MFSPCPFPLLCSCMVILYLLLLSSSSVGRFSVSALEPPQPSNLNQGVEEGFNLLKKSVEEFSKQFEAAATPSEQQNDRIEIQSIFDAKKQQASVKARARRRGERSLTGRMSIDYDLSRMRTGAVAAHSFIAPLLQNNENLQGGLLALSSLSSAAATGLAHWELGKAAVATDHYVRLTPKLPSREGSLWNLVPMHHISSWTAHLGFRVHGDPKMGADGFAFWYQMRPRYLGGPIVGLGSNEQLTDGFGVIFDTFDNDGMNDNPAVVVVKTVDAARRKSLLQQQEIQNLNGQPQQQQAAGKGINQDPANDFKDTRVGQCYRNFRNTAQPVNVVIKYNWEEKTLLVAFADQHCLMVQDLELHRGGYFGFTAHTGGASDNHDLHHFILLSDDDDVVMAKNEAENADAADLDDELLQTKHSGDDDSGRNDKHSLHSYETGGFKREAENADKKKWTGFDEAELH